MANVWTFQVQSLISSPWPVPVGCGLWLGFPCEFEPFVTQTRGSTIHQRACGFFFFFFFFKDQPITWPPTWLKPFGTLPIKTKLDRWTRLSGLLHTHSDGGGGGREVKAHDPFKKKRLKCKIYLLNFTIFYFNSLSLSFVISIY